MLWLVLRLFNQQCHEAKSHLLSVSSDWPSSHTRPCATRRPGTWDPSTWATRTCDTGSLCPRSPTSDSPGTRARWSATGPGSTVARPAPPATLTGPHWRPRNGRPSGPPRSVTTAPKKNVCVRRSRTRRPTCWARSEGFFSKYLVFIQKIISSFRFKTLIILFVSCTALACS